jgi:hypothetical protein
MHPCPTLSAQALRAATSLHQVPPTTHDIQIPRHNPIHDFHTHLSTPILTLSLAGGPFSSSRLALN